MKIRKRIGVKYCGGCNPAYERVEVIEKVQFRLGDQFLFHRHGAEDTEALILVKARISSYSVNEENNYETLIKWPTDFIEKGDSK